MKRENVLHSWRNAAAEESDICIASILTPNCGYSNVDKRPLRA